MYVVPANNRLFACADVIVNVSYKENGRVLMSSRMNV